MSNPEAGPEPQMAGGGITRRKVLVAGAVAAAGLIGGAAVWTGRKGLWLGRLRGEDSARPSGSPRIFDFRIDPGAHPSVVSVARGGEAAALTRAAIASIGGMASFVRRGERVLIKPNVGWDRRPEFAATTHPEVVRALCEMCQNAGAARVIVSDVTCNEMHRCFDSSGIGAAARAAGADVVFPRDAYLKEMDFNGEIIRSWPVYTHFLEVDRIINVPVAKQHGLAVLTLGMKNWFGVIGGLRNRLHQNIHVSVVDLATAIRPTLTVVDATRILVSNGPQGGRMADVRETRAVFASVDPVAVDALAAELFGRKGGDVPCLRIAHSRGLGEIDRAAVTVRDVSA